MNISEFAKPVTAKTLNESLAKRFGAKLNLQQFTLEQLQNARNKLRTQLFNVETNESFNSVQNETYQKSKLMLDVLNAELSERGDIDDESIEEGEVPAGLKAYQDKKNKGKTPAKKKAKGDGKMPMDDNGTPDDKSDDKPAFLKKKNESVVREGAEDHAELVMAAKDMVDRLTGWMEDTAEMQTESMLELADAIRDELGAEQSEGFTNTIKPALDSLYSAMEGARVSLTQGVGMLTGEGEADMLGNDDGEMGDMDMDMEPTTGMDDGGDLDAELGGDDEFGAADAAAGGEEPEERAKRESVDPRKLAGILSKNIKEAVGKMPSKAAVMKCCKEGMSKSDCCKKYPNCDQTKLKEMYESCMSEMKDSKKK